MLKVISLGLGVQSTVLYYMSSMGILPRVDHAIFADTGREKEKTIEYLDFLQQWCYRFDGIPITVMADKNLYRDLLNNTNSKGKRFASIPMYTKNSDGTEGMLRRQCTEEYKIRQVNKAIRQLYGLQPRQRMPETEIWKGITTDEMERLTLPLVKWRREIHPFVGYVLTWKGAEKLDYGMYMSRTDCIAWLIKNLLPVPPKSSCVFCPYQNDASWAEMKENSPADFAAAVQVDKAVRNSTDKGIEQPAFLHRSCLPLDEVTFNKADNGFFGECSGNCHL